MVLNGKTSIEIEEHFNLKLNRVAKSYFANLTKAILGISLDNKIEEFEKAGVFIDNGFPSTCT